MEAAQLLSAAVADGRQLSARVVAKPRPAWGSKEPAPWQLLLCEPDALEPKQSVNARLLAAGIARLARPRMPQVFMSFWLTSFMLRMLLMSACGLVIDALYKQQLNMSRPLERDL